MKRSLLAGLLAGVASAVIGAPACAAETAPANDPQRDNDIIVTGARVAQAGDQQSASPTGLSLSLRETPQSVTVIDRQRIEDFALTNVQDLLTQTVGINVERTETDRTEFNSRGFDITNFQFDGIGLPLFYSIQTSDLDTVLFDRVEAVRGANAIMTGVGNPSATINFLRKRPTTGFQANGSAYLGSFNMWRLDGDVSGPLTTNGALRARVIGAHEERDSYLDYNHVNRDVMAGLLASDVTPALTATLGYSRQDNRSRGVLWGALPLTYSDGTRIDYARSASTSADWTYWNTIDQTAFGELAWKPGGDWAVRGVVTYRRFEESARLLYAFGLPDRTTGRGMQGQTGRYDSNYDQLLFDGYASGSVSLFGRDHQLAFGVSNGRSDGEQYAGNGLAFVDYGDVRDLADFRAPQIGYSPMAQQADTRDLLTRAYGAMHLNLTDRLKGVVGATAIWLKSSGLSYGTDQARNNSRVSPYAGLLYDLTDHLTAYASYTNIFNPQSEVDITNRRLDPASGTSIEAGLKGEWMGGRLYGSAAVFRAEQKGLALFAGQFDGTNGPVGNSYYTGQDSISKGFEVEVAGRMTDRWLVSGGFTHLQIEDGDGIRARSFIPRDTFKLAATYSIEQLNDLKLGGQFRYQSRISNTNGAVDAAGQAVPVVQDAYATLDLLGSIRVIDHVRASVNVRNVTNAKYLGTLKYGQAFYAAPRSVMATLRFDY
ncbi:TonB-dependent siderophore receptor [Sphingomonas pseudosanguinis]|uniref:Outer membrane receptor for ferric coprogen and ferric-rhodotorulic acid n=1 Tax=Sphingomonas pseudosanguinis TaxID=413712 RepID=A0A7W6A9I6_9SPHN|nr:TonB-dependent siderophore receptor [Sphingomonas pseudosanguinis]MBB3879694.1 outer membrane receptor for ferric coprogen and ferric-rhodotorulic acid [Sphingomonas pseudosanguinis]MBN3536462.1 TonB-dependent siderophore receptor [Sphingomonas pseudosanguinis]